MAQGNCHAYGAHHRWLGHSPRELDKLASLLKERGVPCTDPIPGSRVRPDGQTLNWRKLTLVGDLKGNLPFFIDWNSASRHPSSDAPGGCLLQEFRSTGALPEIPPPQDGMRLHIIPGKQAQLQAKIAGLNGVIFQLASIPVPAESWVPKESLHPLVRAHFCGLAPVSSRAIL